MTNEMTAEEAVEILKYERDNDIFVATEYREKLHEALTKAIKALEAQPCEEDFVKHKKEVLERIAKREREIDKYIKELEALEQQPSEDCISRAEVRRILGNEVFELTKLHTVNPEDNPKADAMAYGVNWSLNTLMELPSVTPKYTDEEIDKAQAVEQAYVDKMVELAVEETKRPKGKWIDDCGGVKCSCCGYSIDDDHYAKAYCTNCGAEMSGGEEDGAETR